MTLFEFSERVGALRAALSQADVDAQAGTLAARLHATRFAELLDEADEVLDKLAVEARHVDRCQRLRCAVEGGVRP